MFLVPVLVSCNLWPQQVRPGSDHTCPGVLFEWSLWSETRITLLFESKTETEMHWLPFPKQETLIFSKKKKGRIKTIRTNGAHSLPNWHPGNHSACSVLSHVTRLLLLWIKSDIIWEQHFLKCILWGHLNRSDLEKVLHWQRGWPVPVVLYSWGT